MISDVLDLLVEFGFTARQAVALAASQETVFIVPLVAS